MTTKTLPKIKLKTTKPIAQSFGKSSYWLSNNTDNLMESENSYKLAASKRAISNFVNIVTGQKMTVKYESNSNSYTDGKSITIGSDIKASSDFDVTVGLALHEASHILLSDFQMLYRLSDLIPDSTKNESIRIIKYVDQNTIKGIWNWVEDRRIDYYIYTTAPGYKEYYHSMYNKYFNNDIIDKGLVSSEYRSETLDSYMFRIINFTNPKTDLNALSKLRQIYNTIDLRNIGRLKSSEDSLAVAIKVYDLILTALDENQSTTSDNSKSNSTDNSKSNSTDVGDSSGKSNSNESDNSDDDEISESEMEDTLNELESLMDESGMDISDIFSDGDSNSTSDSTDTNTKPLSDSAKKKLDQWIKKQSDFISGNIKKKGITKKQASEINLIEESNSNIVDVEYTDDYNIKRKVECIVVKNFTESLLHSNTFSFGMDKPRHQSQVDEGVRLGTIIGKKLQIRNESNTTVYNRQKRGRLDKRMISSLGYGNESVFQYALQDSYKKANLHISVDASSSMSSSDKWERTLVNVVALCKAVDMIPNLEVQVSFRATNTDLPYILMAYDSRKDKFMKVKKMFPYLTPSGFTPEGLAFSAIYELIPNPTSDMDSYFLNISDGAPYYNTYQGSPAYRHTKDQMTKMESVGINILSYFISGDYEGYSGLRDKEAFSIMYGNNARFINIESASEVTKTMNQLFLAK
jgi:hypothetical protein